MRGIGIDGNAPLFQEIRGICSIPDGCMEARKGNL